MKKCNLRSSTIGNFLMFFWLSHVLCSCTKTYTASFEVVDIELNNANDSGPEPVPAMSDSVPMQAYAIAITIFQELRHKPKGNPSENNFVNEDRLTSLNVYSLNDFDAEHQANSSLNAYFLTDLNSNATLENAVSNGEIGRGRLDKGEYIDHWTDTQYLFLMTPPAISGDQLFVVELGYSDGRMLCDTIQVNLHP